MNKRIAVPTTGGMAEVFQRFLVILAIMLLTGCASQRISTIVGGEYDATKDATEYFVFPLGKTELPGKWEKSRYSQVSGQQFFHNQDSIVVAVAFNRYDSYEFNQNGSLKGFGFIQGFYEWESKHFDNQGFTIQILESDREKNYIIYRVYGPKDDVYFLIAEKNGNVGNFSTISAEKWTENEKIAFLKTLFQEFTK